MQESREGTLLCSTPIVEQIVVAKKRPTVNPIWDRPSEIDKAAAGPRPRQGFYRSKDHRRNAEHKYDQPLLKHIRSFREELRKGISRETRELIEIGRPRSTRT